MKFFLSKLLTIAITLAICCTVSGQLPNTRFETSNGLQSASYQETMAFYQQLDKASNKILLKEFGPTDASYNLHVVLFSQDGKFDPGQWHAQGKVVVMVNNGIHPGEPDGIDASMMFLRDLALGKVKAPANVVFGIIPVYNIGGCLNRGTTSRANQNGPLEYGFRGNSQNLDLNRDFTKNDSKEAKSFAQIFHYLNPDILIDNHVSDGADYQHTMTMLTTQYNKLGATLGDWLKRNFEPMLYNDMKLKGWDMCPYVDFGSEGPDKGMEQFYDPPRYSSGYAALWQCIGFVPETHMLKPFKDRVLATYAFMQTIMEQASKQSVGLITAKKGEIESLKKQAIFPLSWQVDSSKYSLIDFKGYEQAFKPSNATGLQRMYYDHDKPYIKKVKLFDWFIGKNEVTAPKFYLVPQGWHSMLEILKTNGIQMKRLAKDSLITVQAYHIDDYRSSPRPYEKHHKNSDVKTTTMTQKIMFLKGDYIIATDQPAKRYLVEMLEPIGDDSFFAWNFFDAVLQQKEGYSDYRWDDVAADVLKANPLLKLEIDQKKRGDTAFATSASAQLNWIYKKSAYYEPAHLRYPVYRAF